MSPEEQAIALAEWLAANPGLEPPEGLDPEVVEAVYAIRPDLAPAPRVSAQDILSSLTEGPLATPNPDVSGVVFRSVLTQTPMPRTAANTTAPRWRLPAAIGSVAALAAAVLVAVQVAVRMPMSPADMAQMAASVSEPAAEGENRVAAPQAALEADATVAEEAIAQAGDVGGRFATTDPNVGDLADRRTAGAPRPRPAPAPASGPAPGPALARAATQTATGAPAADPSPDPVRQAREEAFELDAIADAEDLDEQPVAGHDRAYNIDIPEEEPAPPPAATPVTRGGGEEPEDGWFDAPSDDLALAYDTNEQEASGGAVGGVIGGDVGAVTEPVSTTTAAAPPSRDDAETVSVQSRRGMRFPRERTRSQGAPAASDAVEIAEVVVGDAEERDGDGTDPLAAARDLATEAESRGDWARAADLLRIYATLPAPDGPVVALRVAENDKRAGQWRQALDVCEARLAAGVPNSQSTVRAGLTAIAAQARAVLEGPIEAASEAP